MDHSEPLVMTHNMKKHGDLLFHRGVCAIYEQSSLPEHFDKCTERALLIRSIANTSLQL
jgi:hypothetical protein